MKRGSAIVLSTLCIIAAVHHLLAAQPPLPPSQTPTENDNLIRSTAPQGSVKASDHSLPAGPSTPLSASDVNPQIDSAERKPMRVSPSPRSAIPAVAGLDVDAVVTSATDMHEYLQADDRLHHFRPFEPAATKINAWLVMYVPSVLATPPDMDAVREVNPLLALGIQRAGRDPAARRRAVRRQFRKSELWKQHHAKLMFLVSWKNDFISPEVREDVLREQEAFHDLVFVESHDLDLGYHAPSAMTLKVAYGMLHAQANFHFSWFIRGSDDAYCNVDQFYRVVAKNLIPSTRRIALGALMFGVSTSNGRLFHFSKFGRTFPPYLSGMGYILSSDIVQSVTTMMTQAEAPLFVGWPEDAIVTSWIMPFAVHVVSSVRWFHNDVPPSAAPNYFYYPGCVEDAIITHLLGPDDFDHIDDRGVYRGCMRKA